VPVPLPHDHAVTYADFVRRVRRHAQSSMLPQVAALASRYPMPHDWLLHPGGIVPTPWSLAEITRVSFMSDEDDGMPATEQDVVDCCGAYLQILDPALDDFGSDDQVDRFRRLMLRMSSEQLSYQSYPHNELARPIALLEQTQSDKPRKVIVDGWDQELLGCSVNEYIAAAFLILSGAVNSGPVERTGQFRFNWIDLRSFSAVVDYSGLKTMLSVANKHFVANVEELRAIQATVPVEPHPELRRFEFNPLAAKPIVKGVIRPLLLPVPGLLIRKVSLEGVYYTGWEKHGKAFADDLGPIFEQYVGRNLKLAHGGMVHPSITWKEKGQSKETVDWIVDFDDVRLLVEVKSTRPNEKVRLGTDKAVVDLKKALEYAFDQIEDTAEYIRTRHPAVHHIPDDRPMIGLVVTMEPFHVVNAPPYRDLLPRTTVPTRVCAAFELEGLATIQDKTAGRILLDFMKDPAERDSALGPALLRRNYTFGRNEVIDAAWRSMRWIGDRRLLITM
jgi:hypothetical protein